MFDLYLLLASDDSDTADQPPSASPAPASTDAGEDEGADPPLYNASGDGDTVPIALAA